MADVLAIEVKNCRCVSLRRDGDVEASAAAQIQKRLNEIEARVVRRHLGPGPVAMTVQGQEAQEELQRPVKRSCAPVEHSLLEPSKAGVSIEPRHEVFELDRLERLLNPHLEGVATAFPLGREICVKALERLKRGRKVGQHGI